MSTWLGYDCMGHSTRLCLSQVSANAGPQVTSLCFGSRTSWHCESINYTGWEVLNTSLLMEYGSREITDEQYAWMAYPEDMRFTEGGHVARPRARGPCFCRRYHCS